MFDSAPFIFFHYHDLNSPDTFQCQPNFNTKSRF